MTAHRFPYSRISRPTDNPLLQFKNQPLLMIGLSNQSNKSNQVVKIISYIDTGSQWCLFRNAYAPFLGIKDYKKTEHSFPLGGIGGPNANIAYFHNLTLLVFKDHKHPKTKDAIAIQTKIGFVEKDFGIGGILGVYGFLDRFCFTGNIPEHYFDLKQMF